MKMRIFLIAMIFSSASFAASSVFWNHHALLFIFSSRCPHCQRSAPLLKAWSDENGVQVLARTLNEETLPEFPNAEVISNTLIEAAFQNQSIQYPALFVINPSKTLYPVMIGGFTKEELEMRMRTLIPKIKAYERRRT